MSHLHTVNSPGQLKDCVRFLNSGDALVLIENGVYCASLPEMSDLPQNVSVYSLIDDINARGLANDPQDISKKIDYKTFIQLCCYHPKMINWF